MSAGAAAVFEVATVVGEALGYYRCGDGGLVKVPLAWSENRATWPRRIDRAGDLAESYQWAQEVLAFYSRILEFQREVFEATQVADEQSLARDGNLRRALDLNEAAGNIPALVAIVREHGPVKLAEEGAGLRESSPDAIRRMLERWLVAPDAEPNERAFFMRVVLEPQAECIALATAMVHRDVAGNECPVCQSNPQLAVIRSEGDGGKRTLLCSLCHSEWEFRRILCPACGEENHEKLPRYSAEGSKAVRVEACDTCRSYLKAVDLTVDGLAVPEVDEIATMPLDLWAAEHDYRKIQLNLMGF